MISNKLDSFQVCSRSCKVMEISCSDLISFIEKWRNQLDCEAVRMSRDIYTKHRNFFDTSVHQILTDSTPVQNCVGILKTAFSDGVVNLGRVITLLTLFALVHEKMSKQDQKMLVLKTQEILCDISDDEDDTSESDDDDVNELQTYYKRLLKGRTLRNLYKPLLLLLR